MKKKMYIAYTLKPSCSLCTLKYLHWEAAHDFNKKIFKRGSCHDTIQNMLLWSISQLQTLKIEMIVWPSNYSTNNYKAELSIQILYLTTASKHLMSVETAGNEFLIIIRWYYSWWDLIDSIFSISNHHKNKTCLVFCLIQGMVSMQMCKMSSGKLNYEKYKHL